MSLYRGFDDKAAAAPWRVVYDLLPLGGPFDDLLDQLRQQDRAGRRDSGPPKGKDSP